MNNPFVKKASTLEESAAHHREMAEKIGARADEMRQKASTYAAMMIEAAELEAEDAPIEEPKPERQASFDLDTQEYNPDPQFQS